MSADEDAGFLSRWSRRKAQARSAPAGTAPPADLRTPSGGAAPPHSAPPATGAAATAALGAGAAPSSAVPSESQTAPIEAPAPTLEDVAALTPDADYSVFVRRDVDAQVRNAAMRKLFTDPHYNVMDGLDTYIDDYNQTTPIPPSVLRMMVQSEFLGLFDHEKEGASEAPAALDPPSDPDAAAAPAADQQVCDEDPDLRLQPDDAARRSGTDESAGPAEV